MDGYGISITHLMIRVRDMAESIKFYEHALGFTATRGARVPDAFEMVGEPHEYVDIQFLEHPSGPTIELAHAPATEAELSPYKTVLGFAGYGHLACQVPDLEAALQRIVESGGTVFEDSRSERSNGKVVIFACDPNGARIELVGAAV